MLYAVHLLTRWLQTRESSRIAETVTPVITTIVMVAATTMIGFGSMLVAPIAQVRELGITTALGVFYCAVLTIFGAPPLLDRLEFPRLKSAGRTSTDWTFRLMRSAGKVAIGRPLLVAALVVAIAATLPFALRGLHYETDYLTYFRNDEKVVDDGLLMIDRFSGFVSFNLTLVDPQLLRHSGRAPSNNRTQLRYMINSTSSSPYPRSAKRSPMR